jgi:hypothetical protein
MTSLASTPRRRAVHRDVGAVARIAGMAFTVAACHRTPEPEPTATAVAPASAALAAPSAPPVHDTDPAYRAPAPERLVAIGDLHGDLAGTRAALRLAGAIDDKDRWIGGKLVVVQTGDEIDRGDDDRAVIELFDRLADSAQATGGAVRPLVGNHEAMNVAGDFRYVTAKGLSAFADVDVKRVPAAVAAQFPVEARGRLAAFRPGGPFAERLSRRPGIFVVGRTLFVHGGVTLDHVRYGIARFNRELSRWMSGEGAPSALAADPEGPLWTRRYSDDKAGVDCERLGTALAALELDRMVVGHTPHLEGVSSACEGKVWRIDTGLSAFYGGAHEVLEIRGGAVNVLRAAK